MSSPSPSKTSPARKETQTRRSIGVATIVITVLILSGIDDIRIAATLGGHHYAFVWVLVAYALSIAALFCARWPQAQEILLLVSLIGCIVIENFALGLLILGLLAFLASQHGLKKHGLAIFLGIAVMTSPSIISPTHTPWISALLIALTAAGIGTALGSAFRWMDNRREKAEAQAAEALKQAARARAEERQQLAAELHDVVAKDLTVITMLAASLRLNSADKEVVTASKSIETTSRTALDDLQRLLLVLRNQDIPLVSSPTHESSVEATVAAMVRRLETLGWHVDWSVDCEPMPISVSDAVNRILDESTANAIKHNGPATAKIIVRDDDDDVVVTVSNPVTESDIDPVRSTGMGIERLNERVSLLRGKISIGLRNGWWVVNARIPRAKPLRET
ncbi:sensor histidine kinase [Cutibacterium sp.]|uniref:sensor histidine kinase n=1 Tax=Cutibacterium sp. TaxID=1912221 RepID=UPI0026DC7E75|nr:histidine kinase [Cutibacterium sp.]MDO4411757.1 histidine kinase [Cutibacterium sp.]